MEGSKKRDLEQAKLDAQAEVKERMEAAARRASTIGGRKSMASSSKRSAVAFSEDSEPKKKQVVAKQAAKEAALARVTRSSTRTPKSTPKAQEYFTESAKSPHDEVFSVRLTPMGDRRLSGPGSLRGSASNPLTGGGTGAAGGADASAREDHTLRVSKKGRDTQSGHWSLIAEDPSRITSMASAEKKTTKVTSPRLSDVVIQASRQAKAPKADQTKVKLTGHKGLKKTEGNEKHGFAVAPKAAGETSVLFEMGTGCWLLTVTLLLLLLLLVGFFWEVSTNGWAGATLAAVVGGGRGMAAVCYQTSSEFGPAGSAPAGACGRMLSCPAHGLCRSGELQSCKLPFVPSNDAKTCLMNATFAAEAEPFIELMRNRTEATICGEVFAAGEMTKFNLTIPEMESLLGLSAPANATTLFEEMTETFELAGKSGFALAWDEVSALALGGAGPLGGLLPAPCAAAFLVRNNMLVISLTVLLAEMIIWLSLC